MSSINTNELDELDELNRIQDLAIKNADSKLCKSNSNHVIQNIIKYQYTNKILFFIGSKFLCIFLLF